MGKIKVWLCLLVLAQAAYGASVPAVADDMPEQEKVIYLTFDDGPSAYTARLLELLDRYDAQATFFLVDTFGIDVQITHVQNLWNSLNNHVHLL